MLMVSVLTGVSAFLTIVSAPQAECAAQPSVVPVSTTPVPKDAPKADGQLPNVGPKSRDPAVLLPECKEAPRKKRRKRLSDYPMA
jgi:hypothetical protein